MTRHRRPGYFEHIADVARRRFTVAHQLFYNIHSTRIAEGREYDRQVAHLFTYNTIVK